MNNDSSCNELKQRIVRLEQQIKDREQEIATLRSNRDAYKKHHELLREQRFREIIEDVAAISIQGYDEARRVTFWNMASEQIYGYTEQEAIGRQLEDLIIPDLMRSEVIHLHKLWVKDGKKIPAGELMLKHKSGRDVPVFSSHVMLDNGEEKEMFCIDIDLTPIKEAEKEQASLREQLLQTSKMEALGTLAGGVTHDFNNILFSISGLAELLLQDLPVFSPQYKTVEEIFAAVQRGSGLVKQILSFCRKTDHQKQPVSLADIINEVAGLCRSAIPSNIELELNIGESRALIMADPVQIHQVAMNLITNAYQAFEDRSGKISIAIETADTRDVLPGRPDSLQLPQGRYARLKIHDTACGIPPEILGKIFDPYFTTKSSGKGTGLGLATVYGIVKEHRGDILVKSRLGQGTQFTVYLPAVDPADLDIDTISPQHTAAFRQASGNERILLVDDEPTIINILKDMLSRMGYQVTARDSGVQALQCFRENPKKFDLIITDFAMPGMTGIDLAGKVMAIRGDIPVIICSGLSNAMENMRARNPEIKGFLPKPVNKDELSQMIRQVLDGSS